MNKIGTFVVNMSPCEVRPCSYSHFEFGHLNTPYRKTKFLIKPDLLIELTGGSSGSDTTNRDIIAELQEAGQRASQRRSILERLRWGADILDGFVTVVGVASDVRRP